MLRELKELEAREARLRVIVVGAGAMGVGVAFQVQRTPGMELVAVVDIDPAAARRAAVAGDSDVELVEHRSGRTLEPKAGGVVVATELLPLLDGNPLAADVLVECTNTVQFAARGVLAALENRIHVVLMNAEVDLLLGPWLHEVARRNGVGVTSDAGDQHGVLMRMIDEIELWGFSIKMAGNIKGFLDRYATVHSIAEEARVRALNPIQCVAYTDGTKLNIEMALVANATGLLPWCAGMEGPRAANISEVFGLFDFDKYGAGGCVDYVVDAEPGGGVFVVGHSDDPVQQPYLSYYKLGPGPYYLFYRPYHLCHVETPSAIAELCLRGKKVLEPTHGKAAEVATFAKRGLRRGDEVHHGIGGDETYGMVERGDVLAARRAVPIALLDNETGRPFTMLRDVEQDAPISMDDIEIPEFPFTKLYELQTAMLASGRGVAGKTDGG